MIISVEQNLRQKGFVLIITLWVLVILGVMLTTLSYQVRVEAAVERWALNQSKLRWAARGAVHAAAAQIREHIQDDFHSPSAEWWSDENLYQNQVFGEATVSLLSLNAENETVFGLDDEESRLNINVARPENLMAFPGVSSVIAEAIVLFRLKREEALKEEAKEKGEKTEPDTIQDSEDENATTLVQEPIRSLRELLEVKEVTEELLYGIHEDRPPLANLLTTLSSGKININSASEPVLRAIGLSEDTVATIIEQRIETPFNSVTDILGMISLGGDDSKQNRVQKLMAVRSSTFRLNARASLPQKKQVYQIKALLSSSSETLTFIRWQES